MIKNTFKKSKREKFWDSYDPILLARLLEAKADEKEVFGLKLSINLHKDFNKTVNKDGIKKADIVTKAIIEYTYGK